MINAERTKDIITVTMTVAELFILHQMAVEVMVKAMDAATSELIESSATNLARAVFGVQQRCFDMDDANNSVMSFVGMKD